MGYTATLSRFIAKTTPEHLPAAAIVAGKALMTNTVGVTVGGSAQTAGRIGRALAMRWGGAPEATLVGGGCRVAAPVAALANGISAHALDYDDTMWAAVAHPSVAVLPAALAVAEAEGASGRDLLLGYLVGLEIEAKVCLTAGIGHVARGHHPTGTMGTFGAVAAAAKLLRLDAEQTARAFGIAASATAGVRANVGTMTKPFHAGHAAQQGVIAAYLARDGFVSEPASFETDYFGVFFTFEFEHADTADAIAAQLGNPWTVVDPGLTIKHTPCGTVGAVPSDALIRLMATERFGPDDVERIDLGVHPIVPTLMKHGYPTTTDEAKYSMPWVLAVTLVDGRCGVRQFLDDRIADPKTLALLDRLRVAPHAELLAAGPEKASVMHLDVRLQDGRRFVEWLTSAPGYPDRPLGVDGIRARFEETASLALTNVKVDQLWDLLGAIERQPDLRALGELLA